MHTEVVIIGAGPAGSVAAALLEKAGIQPVVLEKQHFPRFSIGESLLPQTMDIMQQAGLLEAVEQQAGELAFQTKNGAVFCFGDTHVPIDFSERFGEGWDYTYEVPRANFDNLLANQVIDRGVDVRFGHGIAAVDFSGDLATLFVQPDNGDAYEITTDFVLDASGFGRVLPCLLDLEQPSSMPARQTVFTHVEDCISDPDYDRDKIRVAVHPEFQELWFWMIPFSNNRMSIGAVGAIEIFEQYQAQYGDDPEMLLKQLISEDPGTRDLLQHAKFDMPVRGNKGFAANVSQLYGERFALLGNAAEFLDPIFSSGVTIAMKSAQLATDLIIRHKQGEAPNWQTEYADELQHGVDVFRAYVQGWYNGQLEAIFTSPSRPDRILYEVCAILAGYVWNHDNPYNKRAQKRLSALARAAEHSLEKARLQQDGSAYTKNAA